jgi:hypothetical protein
VHRCPQIGSVKSNYSVRYKLWHTPQNTASERRSKARAARPRTEGTSSVIQSESAARLFAERSCERVRPHPRPPARLQGIALAAVFQIIIIDAGQRTRDGQSQAEIADQLRPVVENILDELDRWLTVSAPIH